MKSVLVFTLTALFAMSAHAVPVTIDPDTGASGFFDFDGTIGSTQTNPADGWAISVDSDSLIDISVTDCCVAGDAFALMMDGAVTPWDDVDLTGSNNFVGQVDDLFLSAGTHAFDFQVTESCCTAGSADYSFSEVTEATATVPEPGAMALLVLGLVGLTLYRYRRT
ncbi:putative secreted protein with PEP-CTERM sorting signal [Tamilnaduibacter salinus]|nr:PEP-CTERM sorting domain-containing protein [Tamilnaduibacter salinus]PVY79048.1 putative secreted protein with PEP-CTERM sorting signal [Tamilnaduibacter salinus]